MSSSSVYAKQLVGLSYGMPLWQPYSERGEVQLGDVGFLHLGGFYRLFNVTQPADHPWNKDGVPKGFRPLDTTKLYLCKEEQYLRPGAVHSTSISKKEMEVEASISAELVSADLSYSFSCKNSGGAIAYLPDGASREEYMRSRICRDYVCAHHASWVAFAQAQYSVRSSEIVLVYGCVKASSYTLVAYSDQDKEHDFSLSLNAAGVFTLRAGVSK